MVALAMARKQASSLPTLNFLGAEVALLLEQAQVEGLGTTHVPGVLNELADWLSRVHAPGPHVWVLPEVLHHAKLRVPTPRGDNFYKFPVPGKNPSLWGTSAADDAWADAMGRITSEPRHSPGPRVRSYPARQNPKWRDHPWRPTSRPGSGLALLPRPRFPGRQGCQRTSPNASRRNRRTQIAWEV